MSACNFKHFIKKKKIKPNQPLEAADSLDTQSLSTEQPWKVLMKCLVHTAWAWGFLGSSARKSCCLRARLHSQIHESISSNSSSCAGTAKDREHQCLENSLAPWFHSTAWGVPSEIPGVLGMPLFPGNRKSWWQDNNKTHTCSAAAPRLLQPPGAAPQLRVFVRKAQVSLLASIKVLEEIPKDTIKYFSRIIEVFLNVSGNHNQLFLPWQK